MKSSALLKKDGNQLYENTNNFDDQKRYNVIHSLVFCALTIFFFYSDFSGYWAIFETNIEINENYYLSRGSEIFIIFLSILFIFIFILKFKVIIKNIKDIYQLFIVIQKYLILLGILHIIFNHSSEITKYRMLISMVKNSLQLFMILFIIYSSLIRLFTIDQIVFLCICKSAIFIISGKLLKFFLAVEGNFETQFFPFYVGLMIYIAKKFKEVERNQESPNAKSIQYAYRKKELIFDLLILILYPFFNLTQKNIDFIDCNLLIAFLNKNYSLLIGGMISILVCIFFSPTRIAKSFLITIFSLLISCYLLTPNYYYNNIFFDNILSNLGLGICTGFTSFIVYKVIFYFKEINQEEYPLEFIKIFLLNGIIGNFVSIFCLTYNDKSFLWEYNVFNSSKIQNRYSINFNLHEIFFILFGILLNLVAIRLFIFKLKKDKMELKFKTIFNIENIENIQNKICMKDENLALEKSYLPKNASQTMNKSILNLNHKNIDNKYKSSSNDLNLIENKIKLNGNYNYNFCITKHNDDALLRFQGNEEKIPNLFKTKRKIFSSKNEEEISNQINIDSSKINNQETSVYQKDSEILSKNIYIKPNQKDDNIYNNLDTYSDKSSIKEINFIEIEKEDKSVEYLSSCYQYLSDKLQNEKVYPNQIIKLNMNEHNKGNISIINQKEVKNLTKNITKGEGIKIEDIKSNQVENLKSFEQKIEKCIKEPTLFPQIKNENNNIFNKIEENEKRKNLDEKNAFPMPPLFQKEESKLIHSNESEKSITENKNLITNIGTSFNNPSNINFVQSKIESTDIQNRNSNTVINKEQTIIEKIQSPQNIKDLKIPNIPTSDNQKHHSQDLPDIQKVKQIYAFLKLAKDKIKAQNPEMISFLNRKIIGSFDGLSNDTYKQMAHNMKQNLLSSKIDKLSFEILIMLFQHKIFKNCKDFSKPCQGINQKLNAMALLVTELEKVPNFEGILEFTLMNIKRKIAFLLQLDSDSKNSNNLNFNEAKFRKDKVKIKINLEAKSTKKSNEAFLNELTSFSQFYALIVLHNHDKLIASTWILFMKILNSPFSVYHPFILFEFIDKLWKVYKQYYGRYFLQVVKKISEKYIPELKKNLVIFNTRIWNDLFRMKLTKFENMLGTIS